MGVIRNDRRVCIRYCEHNGIKQNGEYRLFGHTMKFVRTTLTINRNTAYRLKRVVKGTHWQLEDYYGSGDDFDKIVERVYKHFK